jgi:hypothetical protein
MALRLFSQQLQNDLILASARGEADKGAQAAREGLLARARARDPTLLPILSRALLEGIKPASPLVVLPQAGREGGRAEAVKAEANGVLVWHLQNKALEALVEVWREGRGAKKEQQQQQQQEEEGGGGGGGGEEGGKEGEKEKEKEKGQEEKKNKEEEEEEGGKGVVEEEGEKGKGKKKEEEEEDEEK